MKTTRRGFLATIAAIVPAIAALSVAETAQAVTRNDLDMTGWNGAGCTECAPCYSEGDVTLGDTANDRIVIGGDLTVRMLPMSTMRVPGMIEPLPDGLYRLTPEKV